MHLFVIKCKQYVILMLFFVFGYLFVLFCLPGTAIGTISIFSNQFMDVFSRPELVYYQPQSIPLVLYYFQ